MVIANLSSTISLQFPVLLFTEVWSRSSLFSSCLLAGVSLSLSPLSWCLQEQRGDVMTLRPSPIRLAHHPENPFYDADSSYLRLTIRLHTTCWSEKTRIRRIFDWFSLSVVLLSQLRGKCEISAGWGMMYGSCVQADADNIALEYHPEQRQETSPSHPGTSQLWYGHYGHLCALHAFSF